MPTAPAVDAGIAAICAGDMIQGRMLLMEAVQADAGDITAWLWLSAAVATPEERRYCLTQVLAVQPHTPAATKGLYKLGLGALRRPLAKSASGGTPISRVAPVTTLTALVSRPELKWMVGKLLLLIALATFALFAFFNLVEQQATDREALANARYVTQVHSRMQRYQDAFESIDMYADYWTQDLSDQNMHQTHEWSDDMHNRLTEVYQSRYSLVIVDYVPPGMQAAHSAIINAVTGCDDYTWLLNQGTSQGNGSKLKDARTLSGSCGEGLRDVMTLFPGPQYESLITRK